MVSAKVAEQIFGTPLVSIIVPTFNSERTLERCLDSIQHQTYSSIQVVVVDRGSSEETVRIARNFGATVCEVVASERSEQKDFGIRASKGKYVYIVDSDFVLEPTVVQEAVDQCEQGGCHAVAVHNSSDPSISFWSKVRNLERDTYIDDDLNVAARFVRKDVYQVVGGLDKRLVAGEDYDFQNRLTRGRFRIGRIRAKEVHIGEPKSLAEIAMKHFYYGKTLRLFVKRNGRRGLAQLSPIRPAFRKHHREIVGNPRLAVGFVIYQSVRYSAAVAGYVVGLF